MAPIALAVGLGSSGAAQPLTVTNFAGSRGGVGWFDGTGSAARFNSPGGVAVDGQGNIYVADTGNGTVRKVSPSGAVTTLAGIAGRLETTDGVGSRARFTSPQGGALDPSGRLWVADGETLRRLTPEGATRTVAGLAGAMGSVDGTGSAARFQLLSSVAADRAGNVYVADAIASTIRKVTPEGVVTTLAGSPGATGLVDGAGAAALFNIPMGVAVDGDGNVFVGDYGNQAIRRVTPQGAVTTLAGHPDYYGHGGFADGPGKVALFSSPQGVAADSAGNVYVADTGNGAIRKVTPGGVVSTLAGLPGSPGVLDGSGSAARFGAPTALAIDAAGNLVVVDTDAVRRVSPDGTVKTIAGLAGIAGSGTSVDGVGSEARFGWPTGVARDRSGNLFVSDTDSATIRKVTPVGSVTTLAGQAGVPGYADGAGSGARFDGPAGIAVDAAGNAYVADRTNNTIRKISPAGEVTTLAGRAASPAGTDDGAGGAARFSAPQGVALDGSGNLLVADSGNFTIRKVSPEGLVTTWIGRAGQKGHVDGDGSTARFASLWGIAVDGTGNVWLTDENTIRRVTPAGAVTTVAGQAGVRGSADGAGSGALFDFPTGLAVDADGSLLVTDEFNQTIRRVTPSGVVTTLAGAAHSQGSDDGTGSYARLDFPSGIAVEPGGSCFVADSLNGAIRRAAPSLPDVAAVGSAVGMVATSSTLGSSPQTATSWSWEVVRRPADSTAPLSSATVARPTFVPDREGLYTFRLTASDGTKTSITTVDLEAYPAESRLLLSGGKVAVTVTWRSQYSGQGGTATSISKGEAYGFFWFSDPKNPEVLVKVLDFGAGRPYLLFWSGLTDFEYTVTFTNVATGKSYSATKAAGSTAGGADATDLPHARAVSWDAEAGKTTELRPGEFLGLEAERERLFGAGTRPGAAGRKGPEAGTELPLAGGQVTVSVTWRSQYSGQTGSATPLPQDDQFGFFYFSDAGNPEVFVKVLDWGASQPYLLFAAGLTDFEYTATYTNVKTGQKVTTTKPAGGYGGYANSTLMGH